MGTERVKPAGPDDRPRRSSAFVPAALLAALTLTVPATADDPPQAGGIDDPKAVAEKALAAHNAERAREKLGPLSLEPRLTEAARLHAVDMATRREMTHDGRDGSTSAARIERQKYQARNSGENVAAGQTTVGDVMTAWMNSPHHRENILGPFTQIGVAVARDDRGRPYWCVDFGTPWPKLDPKAATEDLLGRVNAARADAKRPALRRGSALDAVAAAEAERLSKVKPGETPAAPGDRLTKALREHGYRIRSLAMVAAYGQSDASEVLATLLKEPGNKAQLLGDFADAGLAVVASDRGAPYWCVLLARRLR